ncbi:MAG: antitoxin VapB family protein [Opitutales bacterium]
MATKTISLELDAYEKLKRAKRGSESFSEVVRRARFDAEDSTGAKILGEMAALYASNRGVPKKTLDYWDKAKKEEEGKASISPSPWD